MKTEELNKKIEFIVAQQAQFASDIQVQRETQATDARLLKDAVLAVVGIVGRLAEAQERAEAKFAESQARTDARFAELAEGQARTDARFAELAEGQARTDARFAELAEAQARTDARFAELAEAQARMDASVSEVAERLNIFISVVERHISGNGDEGSAS